MFSVSQPPAKPYLAPAGIVAMMSGRREYFAPACAGGSMRVARQTHEARTRRCVGAAYGSRKNAR